MMRQGKRYRKMQAELDTAGYITQVIRISASRFEVHVNYDVKRTYKQRRSANKYLQRLYLKTFKNNSNDTDTIGAGIPAEAP